MNESENNKKQPTSPIKGNEQSILSETATWLINKISGMRGYSDNNNFFEYKDFFINGCNLSFKELQVNNQGNVYLINSYSSINLRTLVSVKASPDNSSIPLVIFELSEKVVEKSAFYRSGYNKVREPDSTSIKMENFVVFFTGSQATSKQIVTAVNNLSKFCKE